MIDQSDDVVAIKAIVARQFESLCWTRETSADWQTFASDFSPNAVLYPSARPAKPQTVPAFVERMKSLSQTTLHSLEETVLGTVVHVFGKIAVAIVGMEMTENDTYTNRNVEMLLLIKSEGAWRIVCQAWDGASISNPIPSELISGNAAGR